MNTPKSNLQLLFESIRHTIATKHQVPKHLTEDELEYILLLLKPPAERVIYEGACINCKTQMEFAQDKVTTFTSKTWLQTRHK